MFNRIKPFTLTAFAVLALYTFSSCAPTQGLDDFEDYVPHSGQSIFDQFQQQKIVEMTLTTSIDSLIQIRNSNEYHKASISFEDEYGVTQQYEGKVRPRGKFRRRLCDMPPLKLKFSKKQLEAAGFSEHNDLKLVTHCLEDETYSEKLVLREYLAYKLFNELTPNSFQVQLVRITYQDILNSKYQVTQYGFLIEDTDEMTERLGGKECKDCFGLPNEAFHPSAERIAAVFQFMIGNTDWSTQMNRNVKQVEREDGIYLPVPYDFDFSVFVGAPYLRPNSDLNQSTSMERIFTGHSTNVDEVYSTLAYFKTKRNALLEIVRNFDFLSSEERYSLELYLESFFNKLTSKSSASKLLFKKEVEPVR